MSSRKRRLIQCRAFFSQRHSNTSTYYSLRRRPWTSIKLSSTLKLIQCGKLRFDNKKTSSAKILLVVKRATHPYNQLTRNKQVGKGASGQFFKLARIQRARPR